MRSLNASVGFALAWVASCSGSSLLNGTETDGSSESIRAQDGARSSANPPYRDSAAPEGGNESGALPVVGVGNRDGAASSVDSAGTRVDADSRSDADTDRVADAGTRAPADAGNDSGTDAGTNADTDGEVSGIPANCSEEGVLRCVAAASRRREICRDGVWESTHPCSANEICDASNSDEPGTCVAATACRGSADELICVNGIMHECNSDAISVSQQTCQSQAHCEVGLPSGECAVCIPALDHRCEGQALEECTEDGMGYALIDSCSSGICDAVNGQCDVCEAGHERRCTEDGSPAVCDDQGQRWDVETCDPDTPICVGEGICVECITNADCDASDPAAWECNNHECERLTVCGNNVLESGEQCDDGSPEDPVAYEDRDGCGKHCQINAVWGCPMSGTARYLDNSSGHWVWTIPHPSNGIATCVLPCGPYLDLYGEIAGIHGTCEDETGPHPVPGTNPQVYLSCINGACVIPCDGPGDTCPPGYECTNPTVLDMDAYIASGGTSTATTNEYFGCIAQALYRR